MEQKPPPPSLHEIAQMPFPKSVEAMRKHYVHDWAKPVPEGSEGKREYKVGLTIEVHSTERRTISVEAFSEDEAIALAEAEVELQLSTECDDFDIIDAEIRG